MLDNKLEFGGRGRFVDAQDRVPPSSLASVSDGYAVFDLFGTYRMNEAMSVTLNIDNLFDHTYREYLQPENDPGFNARVAMTMRVGAQ